MKKMLGFGAFVVIAIVALAGMYKFNVLQDDIFVDPTSQDMVGSWIEQDLLNSEFGQQGFELLSDGSAQSINTATLRYRSWSLSGDQLTLQTISEGNGSSSEDPIIYTVNSLRIDGSWMTLVPKLNQEMTIKFVREANEDRKPTFAHLR